MIEVAPTTSALAQGRQTKFTPANIRQIINLLDRGKNKEEIAEIIGVTPATLQVTCSKLGISLRRPTIDAAGGSRQRRPRFQNGNTANMREQSREAVQAAERGEELQTVQEATNPGGDHTIIRLRAKKQLTESSGPYSVTLTIRYKGEERIVDLPVDRNALGLFALEAEFRSMSIGDLIGQALLSIAKNDLFTSVLEQCHHPKNRKISGQPLTSNDLQSTDDAGARTAQ
jgi:hypothetical protein